jgi:hypothetical protein
MIEEIRVILAIDIDTNISFASGLHLIHHPNNIKVSEEAKVKDKLTLLWRFYETARRSDDCFHSKSCPDSL